MTNALTRLGTLAEEINREHEAAEKAINESLLHARRCGQLLIEAKGACEHGEWMGWVKGNFRGSQRTANKYMQLAERWQEIEANSPQRANLSINEALALVAEPRDTDDPDPEDDASEGVSATGGAGSAAPWIPPTGTRLAVGVVRLPAGVRTRAWVVRTEKDGDLFLVNVSTWREDEEGSGVWEGGHKPLTAAGVRALLDELNFPVAAAEWEHFDARPGPELIHRASVAEAALAEGVADVFVASQALREIRDRKLYRDSYETFDDYVRAEWGLDAAQVASGNPWAALSVERAGRGAQPSATGGK